MTNNHDIIVLSTDAGESVIWLDARDKDMTLQAQTRMCLDQIADWDEALQAATEPICIQAYKGSFKIMPMRDARRLAIGRGKRRAREFRRRERALGGLLNEAGEVESP